MAINRFLLGKLRHRYIWRRIFYERLTEPLHLNVLSLFVALFGSWKTKVGFDLILRPHNAYGILDAAEHCRRRGIRKMAACEFGVATGAGLMNMAYIARKVAEITGVEITVFGFDTGSGMPKPVDYRDHPEMYSSGDFRMDVPVLRSRLPENAKLHLGLVRETIPDFLERMEKEGYTIGYVVIDVDYYSSACDALKVFGGPPQLYLPFVHVYLDDVEQINHNPAAGELLAVEEFNAASPMRKIYPWLFFENRRIFRRADWLKHMRLLHVHDHAERMREKTGTANLENPYLARPVAKSAA
jgi:hypothetical protein